MSDGIRFHLDENVNPVVALALRRHGIDVTTTVEANLRSSNDERQLAYALEENRVMVTHDDDFLRLAAATTNHPGIAYCHKEARTIGQIISALHLIYQVLTPDEIRGRVEYL
jgi:predicted nuclease of predicted toxin-antitoxin system